MKTYKIITLGCKVNQVESAQIASLLEEAGYTALVAEEGADIIIVNTCAVTNEAAAKSRRAFRHHKKNNPKAIGVLMGCYSQLEGKSLNEKLPEADLIFGNIKKQNAIEAIKALEKERENLLDSVGQKYFTEEILNYHTFDEMSVRGGGDHTRAFVKIQDGCNQFCSYCVIPFVRGPVRSRALDQILLEVKTLAERGYVEIVLTGIHLGQYGSDQKDTIGLTDVIDKIHEIQGIQRIRLSSIEANEITEEMIQKMPHWHKLCPHFHIPLQSGSDEVLQAMNRRYDTAYYKQKINLLRQTLPGVTITTDVIVGFPGEGEGDFEKSMAFIQSMGFMKVHVFPFSKRDGTLAATMDHQVTREEKARRSKLLTALSDVMGRKVLEEYLHEEATVLVEKSVPVGEAYQSEGYTRHYIRVVFQSKENLENKEVAVNLQTLTQDGFIAVSLGGE